MQVDQAREFHRFDASTANTQILCRLTDEALEFIVSRQPQAMTETPFRRVPACAIFNKRTFETPFKFGAVLVRSPQAHDRNILHTGTRLCNFSEAHV